MHRGQLCCRNDRRRSPLEASAPKRGVRRRQPRLRLDRDAFEPLGLGRSNPRTGAARRRRSFLVARRQVALPTLRARLSFFQSTAHIERRQRDLPLPASGGATGGSLYDAAVDRISRSSRRAWRCGLRRVGCVRETNERVGGPYSDRRGSVPPARRHARARGLCAGRRRNRTPGTNRPRTVGQHRRRRRRCHVRAHGDAVVELPRARR